MDSYTEEEVMAITGSNAAFSHEIDSRLNRADGVKDYRRIVAEQQVKCSDLCFDLSNELQAVMKKCGFTYQQWVAFKESIPENYRTYIRELENLNNRIWCGECMSTKNVDDMYEQVPTKQTEADNPFNDRAIAEKFGPGCKAVDVNEEKLEQILDVDYKRLTIEQATRNYSLLLGEDSDVVNDKQEDVTSSINAVGSLLESGEMTRNFGLPTVHDFPDDPLDDIRAAQLADWGNQDDSDDEDH